MFQEPHSIVRLGKNQNTLSFCFGKMSVTYGIEFEHRQKPTTNSGTSVTHKDISNKKVT